MIEIIMNQIKIWKEKEKQIATVLCTFCSKF